VTEGSIRMVGDRFPAGAGNFSLRHRVQTTQPPIQLVPVTLSRGKADGA